MNTATATLAGHRYLRFIKSKLQVWVARHMWWLLPLSIFIDIFFIGQ